MNSIHIDSFERDAEDSHGKTQPLIYHCHIAGRAKALTRKELLAAIELTLREGAPMSQPASTLSVDYESANGH